MKEKIILQLKAKYPGVNLSQTRLDAIADKLTPKITEETEIDAKLDELNDIFPFVEIAKQDDRMRTLEAKAKKPEPKPEPKKKKEDDDDQDEPAPADQMPSWFKPFAEKLEGIENEKKQVSIQSKFKERVKDIPAIFYKGRMPQKEEEIETVAAEIEADYSELMKQSGLGPTKKPVNGSSGASDKAFTKEEIKAINDKIIK